MSIKIGILTLSSPGWGGVFQYTLTLLEALKNLHNEWHEFIQLRNKSFPKILERDIVIKGQNVSPIVRMRRLIYAFMGIKLGNLAPKVDVDFIISPTITLLPFYMQKPYVVVIHDFQYKYYPEFFTLKQRIILEVIYRTGKKANLVVCESNYVKR